MSNYDERKLFLEQMTILSRPEMEEVFRILKRHNDVYSENTNGIFFDIAALRSDTFKSLQEFMGFCVKNRSEQEERTVEMNAIRDECITKKDIIPNNNGSLLMY